MMMSQLVYGYIRVSSKDQKLDRQRRQMLEYGIPQSRIVADKQSGKDLNRPGYQALKGSAAGVSAADPKENPAWRCACHTESGSSGKELSGNQG